jgi:hypothetical protein
MNKHQSFMLQAIKDQVGMPASTVSRLLPATLSPDSMGPGKGY